MKIIPNPEILANIRLAIKHTRESLNENRTQRKELAVQIRGAKIGVKERESLCSKMVNASIPEELPRHDLVGQRRQLYNLRQNLVASDIYRSIELAKFHVLHDHLDRFGEPFTTDTPRKNKEVVA